jgi:hypothetical protein
MIKVSEFIAQHKQGKISNATMIKMAAFKNELEKNAVGESFLTGIGAKMTESLPGMFATAGGLGIGALIWEGVQKIEKSWMGYKLDSTKEPLFQQMLKLHPELAEDEQTKGKAALYFDSLWHFSPAVAQDPLAAGAYIRQSLQMHHVAGGPIPDLVKQLTEIQKNVKAGTPDSEYSTPLGAVFLSLKPQAGGLKGFDGDKGKEKETSPNIIGTVNNNYANSRTISRPY